MATRGEEVRALDWRGSKGEERSGGKRIALDRMATEVFLKGFKMAVYEWVKDISKASREIDSQTAGEEVERIRVENGGTISCRQPVSYTHLTLPTIYSV